MDYKKTIIEVMNRNGYTLTNEANLLDLVLLIERHKRIHAELVAKGVYAKSTKRVKELQVA